LLRIAFIRSSIVAFKSPNFLRPSHAVKQILYVIAYGRAKVKIIRKRWCYFPEQRLLKNPTRAIAQAGFFTV